MESKDGLQVQPQSATMQAATCTERGSVLYLTGDPPSCFSSSSISCKRRLMMSSVRDMFMRSSGFIDGNCSSSRQQLLYRSRKPLKRTDCSLMGIVQKRSGHGQSGQKQNFSWDVCKAFCSPNSLSLYLLMSCVGCSNAQRNAWQDEHFSMSHSTLVQPY